VLARAREAIAPHPGPVRASAMVRAARTDTGQWYVVALDREYVLDDGSATGDGSRTLGLTNAINHPGASSQMILIGEGGMRGNPSMTWHNVAWRGDRLAAGERAAERAVECLDAASPE
jgi:hypothetical protein